MYIYEIDLRRIIAKILTIALELLFCILQKVKDFACQGQSFLSALFQKTFDAEQKTADVAIVQSTASMPSVHQLKAFL